uniref:Uncharacterized protein n=1 Tax=Rhizophora mucronata TaxID=61149 RepID=A0A2P2QM69_RHIMU
MYNTNAHLIFLVLLIPKKTTQQSCAFYLLMHF